jgi:regulator of replication initiation timing
MFASEEILNWLLELENPSLRYRTLVELLDKSPDDKKAIECKEQIAESTSVKNLLSKMHPDGYWLQRKPSTGKMVGDSLLPLLLS